MSDNIPEELRGKKSADLNAAIGRPDELKGKTARELENFVELSAVQLRSLYQSDTGEIRELDAEEQDAFDYLSALRTAAIDIVERDRKVQEVLRRKPEVLKRAAYEIATGSDGAIGAIRGMSNHEARDAALRSLDDRESTAHLADDQKEHVARQIRKNPVIARRVLVTENEDYRSAFMKLVSDPHPFLTQEEQRAMQTWNEFRAMADFTTTAGGFGIPVYIDPSIIMTAQGSNNPFLQICRSVDINTTVWKGVSSAGVTWAFQTEGAVTTDNAPTLAQPTVAVHMARGFIPFSFEVQTDYPGFSEEMSMMLASGYNELLVQKFTTGSGTGEPKGILTAISATSADRVKVTTGGSIGSPDPYLVWKALPQRFRTNASWLMSVGVNNAIRQLGTSNVYHAYTTNLPDAWTDVLFNKPVYESTYMPDTTTWTTTAEGQAVVGDFSQFVIARNGGMSVELIPQLFQQQTAATGVGFPTGQRGLFAHARIGSDCVNTAAFRLLVANS